MCGYGRYQHINVNTTNERKRVWVTADQTSKLWVYVDPLDWRTIADASRTERSSPAPPGAARGGRLLSGPPRQDRRDQRRNDRRLGAGSRRAASISRGHAHRGLLEDSARRHPASGVRGCGDDPGPGRAPGTARQKEAWQEEAPGRSPAARGCLPPLRLAGRRRGGGGNGDHRRAGALVAAWE